MIKSMLQKIRLKLGKLLLDKTNLPNSIINIDIRSILFLRQDGKI